MSKTVLFVYLITLDVNQDILNSFEGKNSNKNYGGVSSSNIVVSRQKQRNKIKKNT